MNQLDNLDGFGSAAQQHAEAEWLARRDKYGPDPATKEQAASREAGRAIMTAVLGWFFDGARISRKGKVWTGANYFTHRLTGKTFCAADEPEMVFEMAAQRLAGQVAELHAGVWHPTSSVHEAASAAALCTYLDVLYGLPAGTQFERAAEFARDQIALNWPTFDLIRTHLMRTCRLWPVEGRRMLGAVSRAKAPAANKRPALHGERSVRTAAHEAAELIERSKKDSG